MLADIRRQPPFRCRQIPALAAGIVLDLILLDPPDAEIVRLRVAEVQTRHAGRRVHGEAFGKRHAGLGRRVQDAEQLGLLSVIGLGRIACGRTDAAVLLADQGLDVEELIGGVAPQLGAHLAVHGLGEGLGQAVITVAGTMRRASRSWLRVRAGRRLRR